MNAPLTLDEIFYATWNAGKLDARCRQSLQAKLTNGVTKEEQQALNRILHAVRRGWVEVDA